MIKEISTLLRLKHWIKNLIVFAPLLFSLLFTLTALKLAACAFLAFCLVSSSIYILNDIHDLEADKLHPKKRHRALPSGLIKVKPALAGFVLLAISSLLISWQLNLSFFLCTLSYLVLNIFYTYKGKNLVIIDAFCIALGFVLRVSGGAFAISVIPSGWILMSTFFLCLFMGFGKRRNELLVLKTDSGSHRQVLNYYTDSLLNLFILSSGTVTIISYTMYTLSPLIINRYHTAEKLVWTIPFVTFIIFRYMYLIWSREEGDPTDVILKDPVLLCTGILWLAVTIGIMAYSLGKLTFP